MEITTMCCVQKPAIPTMGPAILVQAWAWVRVAELAVRGTHLLPNPSKLFRLEMEKMGLNDGLDRRTSQDVQDRHGRAGCFGTYQAPASSLMNGSRLYHTSSSRLAK